MERKTDEDYNLSRKHCLRIEDEEQGYVRKFDKKK